MRRRLRLACLVAAALGWAAGWRPPAIAAPGQAAGTACPAALVATAQAVSTLRSVPDGLAPACRVISPAQLRRELDRKLRRDLPLPPEQFLKVLVRLGFINGDPKLTYERLLDFYTSQVLGFYEPDRDEMVLIDTPAATGEQATLLWAHELAHAAQEKRFSLPSRLLAMRHDSDRQRAASAIAEGEAMLVMLFLSAPPGQEQVALAAAQRAASGIDLPTPRLNDVPAFFVADLIYPYSQGLTAVLAAYRRGGWAAVDELLARPPASTAELRDPARPFSPVSNEELPPVPAGFREVLTDTLGEWAMEFWLGQVLSQDAARRLAGHWSGDRLRLVEHLSHPERWALAWVIRTPSSAARQALERGLQAALPRLLPLRGKKGPPEVVWLASGTSLEVRVHWPAQLPAPLPAPGLKAPAPPP